MRPRMHFVDGLRGIASMMVLLFHLVGRTSLSAFSARGYLGVAIFFVLSGFVISSTISQEISWGYIGRYAARRFVRLDIPYWTSIVVAIAFAVLATHFGAAWSGYNGKQVMAHLFYLQDILGFAAISPTYWTLCYEIQFYLSLLFLLGATQALSRSAFRIVFLFTIALSLLANVGVIATPQGTMVSYWWAFGLGAITWWTVSAGLPLWIFVLTAVAALAAPFAMHADWRLVSTATAILLLVAARWGTMGTWLSDRVSQFLGKISYSCYLIHPIIGWSVQSFAMRHCNQYVALLIGVTVSLVCSWVFYVVIERPAQSLSRQISLKEAGERLAVQTA